MLAILYITIGYPIHYIAYTTKTKNQNKMKKNSDPEKKEIFLKDIPVKTYAQSIQFVQPIQMSWKPKEDITPYELAMCLPYFVRFNIMPFEIDQSLPHFRHFKIIDPNK